VPLKLIDLPGTQNEAATWTVPGTESVVLHTVRCTVELLPDAFGVWPVLKLFAPGGGLIGWLTPPSVPFS
jgi:hypothetical protein